MFLIIGLGNPGKKYVSNRHNLGFMVLDALAKGLSLNFKNCQRTNSRRTEGILNGKKVILAKPKTFMNDSGQSVAKLTHYYRVRPENIWLIHDDLDLPLGQIRIRKKGSSGGHQGVASVIKYLETENFNRLKIGIGSNREKNLPAEVYVLQNFLPEEKEKIRKAVSETEAKLKNLI